MKPAGWAAAASLVLGLAAGVAAVGTILTTDADIAVGDGATAGTITIDPAFPLVAPPTILDPATLGSIGTITGSFPAFPGAGTGADGIFTSGTGATLAAGTYNFTSFTVSAEAPVTCSGPVVIKVTGNMTVSGPVFSSVAGGSIAVHCGGNLTVTGGDAVTTARGFTTSGANSPVVIFVQGDVKIGDPLDGTTAAFVTALHGPVNIFGHGAASAFVISNGIIEAFDGLAMVRSAAALSLTGQRGRIRSSVGAAASQMIVQAAGGNLLVGGGALVQASDFTGQLLVEASGSVTVSGGGAVLGSGNPSVFVTAFGGGLSVDAGTLSANASGTLVAQASAGISLGNGSGVSTVDGPLALLAHGGDVEADIVNISTYHGSLRVAASDDVALNSFSNVTSFDGRTDIDAFGDVLVTGDGNMLVGSFTGDLEVVAAGAVVAEVDDADGPNCTWRGGAVRIHAGLGADLDVMEVISEIGDLDLIAGGPVASHDTLSAEGNLSVESAAGNIDIAGGTLVTAFKGSAPTQNLVIQSLPPPDFDSGDILVWCHLQNGTIDASGASIQTGESPDTSGSISLLVNGVSPPVESFILPKKINAKYDPENPGNSRLVASGFLDTGPDEVDLAGSAVVDVGDLAFEVDGFTPNGSGTKFSYKSDGLAMSIKASKVGSSRASFRLLAKGAFAESPDLDGNITLRFSNQVAEGVGTVDLDGGKFTLGKKRGSLVEPNLHLFRAKATLNGEGEDILTLKLGLATNGITPEAAPDLHIGFGVYEADINGGTLVRSGDKFVFHGPAGGVTLVILDYLKETITIQAKGVDLGEIAEGSSAVPIRIGLGGDERIVTVRMGRRGTAFVY